jgi:hypothetical protein
MDEIFRTAAQSALIRWSNSDEGLDDLVGDLWVWYLERPGTQKKLANISNNEAVETIKIVSMQILSGNQLRSNEFNGRNLYSSDNIREALLGETTNHYLADILPLALEALEKQNRRQVEAIRIRYYDGVIPARGTSEEAMLKRAVKSLTEHVNIIAITAGVDADGNVSEGPGSRHAVFPDTRPTSGDHSDPTADIAIMLLEHPELRDEYLQEQPLPEFLGGKGYAQLA